MYHKLTPEKKQNNSPLFNILMQKTKEQVSTLLHKNSVNEVQWLAN